MAQLNPSIILAGQQPNLVNALAGGAQAANAINTVQRQNKLMDTFQEHGPGIIAGEQPAMNALSMHDPRLVMDIQNQRQTMDVRGQENARADERLQMARADAARAAQLQAAKLSQAEREQELAAIDRALAGATQIQDPQQWDGYMQSLGLDQMVGQFENRDVAFATALGIKDGLAMGEGPEPQSPQGKLQADINAGLVPAVAGADRTEAEQEISRLMEIPGVTRETAIKLKEGVYKIHTDPVDRTTYIVDMTTKQPVQLIGENGAQVGGGQPVPQQPGQTGQAAPMTPTRQPQSSLQQTGQLSFGQDVPTGGDQAFGLFGVARNMANTVTDAVGIGEVFPNAAEQQRFFKLMEEDLLVDLSQAYGRQPAMALMERIRSLLPQAGTIEGADRARGELQQLRRRFERDLQSTTQAMSGPGRVSPQDRTELVRQRSGLRSTLGTIDEALERLGGAEGQGGSGEIPSSFVESIGESDGMTAQEIWDAMPPEDRQLWQN